MRGLICKTENLAEKIEFQKQAVAFLRKEIFGTDKKLQSKYIRDFMTEFEDFEEISSYQGLIEAAKQSRIIYIGDFHALDKYQQFQARFLEDIADRPLILALEMFYGRNQRALDDWIHGRIDDEQLLRRVRYELEWGYRWDSYRAILEVVRKLHIPAFGVDCSPRNDLRFIGRRDSAVAAKIVDLLQRYPEHTLVVLFGESHLASNHIPRKVQGHFPGNQAPRHLTVLQNIDAIYWNVACSGSEGEQVVKINKRTYCVFNATPFEKYEGYRRQLEIWKTQDEEDEAVDLTSSVYSLIDTIVDFARIDKYAYCLTREGVCLEFLIDAYPEVYSFEEFEDFEALLQLGEFNQTQIYQIIHHTMQKGSCYVPRINAIFIGKFNLVHGAEEAAHFVNFSLKRQRCQHYRAEPLGAVDEFYLRALEEALGYFGSKLIDSRRNHVVESAVLNWKRATKKVLGISTQEARWMRRFVITHKDMERRFKSMKKVSKIITQGVASRGRTFTLLTHELGYLLGEQLYRGYLAGIFSRRELARLFHTRFEEAGPTAAAYFTLAERAEPLW